MQLYTKILIGMVVGILFGILVGPNSMLLKHDTVILSNSAKVVIKKGGETVNPLAAHTRRANIQSVEQDGWAQIQWSLDSKALLQLQAAKVEIPAEAADGNGIQGWTKIEAPAVRTASSIGLILVDTTEWIGLLFLALIKMVVVPLVFFSLVVGVATLGDLKDLGRMGSRTLGYFFSTTVGALVIGLSLGNLFPPAALLSAEDRTLLTASYSALAESKAASAAKAPSFVEQIVGLVPTNPVSSLATGNMLQIIVFAVLLGVAMTMMKKSRAQLLVDVFDRLNDAMVLLVHIAMLLAPYGVAALLFKVAGTTGLSVLLALAGYSGLVMLGLLLHVLLIYVPVVTFGARLNPLKFFSGIKEALMLAFSTSSSAATLPITKECCEQNLNASPKTASFVLPLGATINMDGTALYQAIATLFIAEVYMPGTLTFIDQLTIVFTATLASVGAAGVPGAGIVTLAMVLTAINVPVEGIALILGVDRILDMFRTVTNVFGDATATCLIARLEGEDLQLLTDAQDSADPSKGFEGRLSNSKD
jgi:Na+/H+-dicarboxylate symporter